MKSIRSLSLLLAFSGMLNSIQVDAQRFDPNFVLPLGIGIASPTIEPGRSLYFYATPDFDVLPDRFKPIDSITFKKGEHYTDIATAPPWLVPEHLKLDYGIFTFRVLTYSQNWLEVIVNNTNGLTRWVDRHAFGYTEWGTYLTEIVAVEIIDVDKNPIRISPQDNASILAQVPDAQLRPIAVKGDWLLVSTVGLADRIVPTGWVRWKRDGVMLVMYSILS
ncbi:MAG TPA: hypothetical protein PKN99_07280 [Cyclobacteriaceae bacterium]|nr:hypothetical protein [Cyclobacteriaceae bacterium]HNP07412.1 hypothetical protein [Cyclobacteriaceae bacterium]HRK52611.1 hypothetical protein [Cyclobacteriaceae bacterium]